MTSEIINEQLQRIKEKIPLIQKYYHHNIFEPPLSEVEVSHMKKHIISDCQKIIESLSQQLQVPEKNRFMDYMISSSQNLNMK